MSHSLITAGAVALTLLLAGCASTVPAPKPPHRETYAKQSLKSSHYRSMDLSLAGVGVVGRAV